MNMSNLREREVRNRSKGLAAPCIGVAGRGWGVTTDEPTEAEDRGDNCSTGSSSGTIDCFGRSALAGFSTSCLRTGSQSEPGFQGRGARGCFGTDRVAGRTPACLGGEGQKALSFQKRGACGGFGTETGTGCVS